MPQTLEQLYDAAREALQEGDLRTANVRLKSMQDIDPDSVRTIEIQGDIAVEEGKLNKARATYLRLCDRTDDAEARRLGEYSLGLLDLAIEERAAAQAHFQAAIELYKQAGATHRLKPALGVLGQLASETGELQLAADTLRELLAIGPTSDPDDEEAALYQAGEDAEAYRLLGDTLRLLGQLPEAEAAFRQAIAGFEQVGDDRSKSACLDGLGIVMQVADRFDEAEKLHLQCLEICEPEEDLEVMGAAYGNLTMLSIHRKDWRTAIQWAEKSLKADKTLGNEDGIAATHLHLAQIEIERKNFDAAQKHLSKSRKYYQKHGTPLDMLSVISNTGELHLKRGDFAAAERELQESLRMAEEMGHGDGIAKVNDQLAELRKAQGRLDEARSYWQLSLTQYEALGSSAMVQEIKTNLEKLG